MGGGGVDVGGVNVGLDPGVDRSKGLARIANKLTRAATRLWRRCRPKYRC